MNKITSVEQLNKECAALKDTLGLRLGATEDAKYRKHILICGGTGCTSSGSAKLREGLEAELAAKGIADEIKIVTTGCLNLKLVEAESD